MTIDLAIYERNKKFVISWHKSKGKGDIDRSISMMASITFCPAIVIAFWLAEYTNWSPDAVNAIRRLKVFYRYTKVINKPEGCPEDI